MDCRAVGDTTNVAARLQQAAHPGQVVISEATHRLIEGYFDTHPLGALQLKGKADAVPGWEVPGARGARTRFEVRAERGLTPFVGRQRELGMLLERFEQANDGQGQVVFIVGEPGIGKSRLLYELHGRLGEAVTWLEGRCLSFGRSLAFHPLIDRLRRSFGIEESDLDAMIVEKIEGAVLALGDELRPTLPFLRYSSPSTLGIRRYSAWIPSSAVAISSTPSAASRPTAPRRGPRSSSMKTSTGSTRRRKSISPSRMTASRPPASCAFSRIGQAMPIHSATRPITRASRSRPSPRRPACRWPHECFPVEPYPRSWRL